MDFGGRFGRVRRVARLSLLLAAIGAGAGATAQQAPARPSAPDCSTESPAKRAGVDLNTDDEELRIPLSREQIASFEAVAEAIAFRWSGTETGFACERGVRRQLNRTIVSEGRAEGALQFMLESSIAGPDRRHRESLRIGVRNEQLWVNQGGASLTEVSEHGLEFGYRERVGGAVSERYWRITFDGQREMRVERAVYTNGAMVEATAWDLSKPN